MTYYSPGVYIEEVPSGPQPISAAPTSVLAVLGTTRRGPVLTPTRVTGWSEFIAIFGPATSRSFTAESVYGFFENGGPAAWVVRVDPSTPAHWSALDSDGVASLPITATSGGTWANGLRVSVAPDASGPAGRFFSASTQGGTVAFAAGVSETLTVSSTAGLRVGDHAVVAVVAVAFDALAAPFKGEVTALTATTIDLTFASAVQIPEGSRVASATVSAQISMFLPRGKGFRAGDLVVAIAPNGARSSALVVDVVEVGTGLTLTLDSPLGDVPGTAFVRRRAIQSATWTRTTDEPSATPPVTPVRLSEMAFEYPDTAPQASDLSAATPASAVGRITMSDGREATWVGGNSRFEVIGSKPPSSGKVMVDAPLVARRLIDATVSIQPLTEADVTARFGFLPEGAQVLLTTGTAADDVTATRTAIGFDFALDPDETIDASHLFNRAEFKLQANADAGIAVRAAVEIREGDHLELGGVLARVDDVLVVGGGIYVLRFAGPTPVVNLTQERFGVYSFADATVGVHRFTLTIQGPGVTPEVYDGLSLSENHPRYYAKDGVINGVSALIEVDERASAAPPVSVKATPAYIDAAALGSDQPATGAQYATGLTELEAEPEPAMVICPDVVKLGDPMAHADIVGKVIAHCESFRRFALLDAPDTANDQEVAQWRNSTVASTYAAVFAPHVDIITIDPDSAKRLTRVPPSGFVAGVFARTDRERGVHKAPGNERVQGIVGLAKSYTQRHQDYLNPAAVNLIRAFPGRGSRLWGARNATDDALWRYINVRRLFNMIENSVDRSTQWVVFEPNTPTTWIRVKVSVENFLEQQWRAGALAGSTPEQAYRVRVGLGETMTEDQIANGYIVTEVAIAPARPAEFVVFRFSHKRLSD